MGLELVGAKDARSWSAALKTLRLERNNKKNTVLCRAGKPPLILQEALRAADLNGLGARRWCERRAQMLRGAAARALGEGVVREGEGQVQLTSGAGSTCDVELLRAWPSRQFQSGAGDQVISECTSTYTRTPLQQLRPHFAP